MASISGLSKEHRYEARQMAKDAALLTWNHRGVVHYTQGYLRWQGIQTKRRSVAGNYPNWADCSALVTWCLWNGLNHFGVRDTVNNNNWQWGSTYTQLMNGKRILLPASYLTGDLVFYNNPAHVAIIVDPHRKLVISHGQESGPHLLEMHYRRVYQVRRYI